MHYGARFFNCFGKNPDLSIKRKLTEWVDRSFLQFTGWLDRPFLQSMTCGICPHSAGTYRMAKCL